MQGSTHQFGTCSNCGATVEQAADGRSIVCRYCGSKEAKSVDPSHLAASLQAEFKNIEQFFEHLAERLAHSFPDNTRVETEGGFFSTKKVESLEVTLGDNIYRMKREGGKVLSQRVKIVRGVALKTEHLAVDVWVHALCEGLAAMASASAAAHAALARMVQKQ